MERRLVSSFFVLPQRSICFLLRILFSASSFLWRMWVWVFSSTCSTLTQSSQVRYSLFCLRARWSLLPVGSDKSGSESNRMHTERLWKADLEWCCMDVASFVPLYGIASQGVLSLVFVSIFYLSFLMTVCLLHFILRNLLGKSENNRGCGSLLNCE